jgi:hypothetical protein
MSHSNVFLYLVTLHFRILAILCGNWQCIPISIFSGQNSTHSGDMACLLFLSNSSKLNYCRRLVSKKNCRRGNSVFLLLETEIKACNGYGAAQKRNGAYYTLVCLACLIFVSCCTFQGACSSLLPHMIWMVEILVY